jgi:putative PIN family toxin of toxin-antitoxin system
MRVVLDTNVLVAAIRSRRGASFEILSNIGMGALEIAVSVPLVLEYESVLLRHAPATLLSENDIQDMIDYICGIAVRHEVFFLWRPQLKDPGDDFVLEIAVAANCDAVVTHNIRDFAGSGHFGVRAISPAQFLTIMRSNK